jgi:hypothetical protein
MLGLVFIAAVDWAKGAIRQPLRAVRVLAVAALLRFAPLAPGDARPPPPRLPAILTPEETWRRAVSTIREGLLSFERIERLGASAAEKIDVAAYVFDRLLDELATAMPLPADGAPLRAILEEAAKPPAQPKKAKSRKKRLAA